MADRTYNVPPVRELEMFEAYKGMKFMYLYQ